MLGNLFNKATGYIKVKKENWDKIENLLLSKNSKIQSLEDELKALRLQCEDSLRYQANDKLVEVYEDITQKIKNENKFLRKELDSLEVGIKETTKKIDAVMGLESTYLQKISRLQHKVDTVELANIMKCPEYDEKGQDIVALYA